MHALNWYLGCNMLSLQPTEYFRLQLFFDALSVGLNYRYLWSFPIYLAWEITEASFNCFIFDFRWLWTSNIAAWASISFKYFWIYFRYCEHGLLDSASFMPERGFSSEAVLKVLISFAYSVGPCFCQFEGKTYPYQVEHSVLSCLSQHSESWKTGLTAQHLPLSCGSLPLASCTTCDPSSSWSSLVIAHYYGTAPGLHLKFLEIFLEIAKHSSAHLRSTTHKIHRLQTASSCRWSCQWCWRPPAGCWRCHLLCCAQHCSWNASISNLFTFFAFINNKMTILSNKIEF